MTYVHLPLGTAEDYELPFEYKVPPDPSFDDMREAVVLKGLTPDIPNRWIDDEVHVCMYTPHYVCIYLIYVL